MQCDGGAKRERERECVCVCDVCISNTSDRRLPSAWGAIVFSPYQVAWLSFCRTHTHTHSNRLSLTRRDSLSIRLPQLLPTNDPPSYRDCRPSPGCILCGVSVDRVSSFCRLHLDIDTPHIVESQLTADSESCCSTQACPRLCYPSRSTDASSSSTTAFFWIFRRWQGEQQQRQQNSKRSEGRW